MITIDNIYNVSIFLEFTLGMVPLFSHQFFTAIPSHEALGLFWFTKGRVKLLALSCYD